MANDMAHAERPPLLRPGQTYATATDHIASIVLSRRTPRAWFIGFAVAFILAMAFVYGFVYLLVAGVGIFGMNIPVAWAFPITNVVWWIGIGHAGTLISAILLLLRQKWRNTVNRFAEAMTLFAVAIAGLFPIIHLGRPWFFYWLLPYPNTMDLWPQWRSPLVWDFFAIATYAIVSLIFWYMALIPDLATLRDRARTHATQVAYGILSLGWRGSAVHWARFERSYLIIAALATPLVVSVHSVISFDFSVALVPGYHSTVFPPYFVAGALYSGFAMVLTIAIPLRAVFGLHDFITLRHFDVMSKLMLAAGLFVAYGYLIEYFIAWYSGSEFHRYLLLNRAFGPYAEAFWVMMFCNVGMLQFLWFRRVRQNLGLLFALSIIINVGMWLERYVIVITSTQRDFMPSMWDTVDPTLWDWIFLFGSLGMFFTLMFLFVRLLPAITIFEVRGLIHEAKQGRDHG